jgi:hypothetical protein
VCPEIAKISPIGIFLAYLIEKSYDFAAYRVVQGFFPGGIRLKMWFGIADSQVDALFRLNAGRIRNFQLETTLSKKTIFHVFQCVATFHRDTMHFYSSNCIYSSFSIFWVVFVPNYSHPKSPLTFFLKRIVYRCILGCNHLKGGIRQWNGKNPKSSRSTKRIS